MHLSFNYEDGDCVLYAVALHYVTGYPLYACIEYDADLNSTVLIHAYVINQEGERMDVTGVRSLKNIMASYPNNGDPEEVSIGVDDLLALNYGKHIPSVDLAVLEVKRNLPQL